MTKFLAKTALTFLKVVKIESVLILMKIFQSGIGFQLSIKVLSLLLISAVSTTVAMPSAAALGARTFMSVPASSSQRRRIK